MSRERDARMSSSPRVVTVATEPAYTVQIGPDVLAGLGSVVAAFSKAALVADERVVELHGERLEKLDATRLELTGGEDVKSFSALEATLDFLVRSGLDRGSCVVAFGGGSITDLAGLAASLFMRGIAVVHVPTTLLAQVDASVGGKTAINLAAGKNLAGTFWQPRAVFCDTGLLATLPAGELRSGLGEVLKSALIGGPAALEVLERNVDSALAAEPSATAELVATCVAIKAGIVAADPHEGDRRRVLNLGHTFAHAVEAAAGFGRVPHGIAVATGIGLAFEASARAGLLADEALRERARDLAGRLGLPFGLGELETWLGFDLESEALIAGLAHDKKGRAAAPRFVLPVRAGELRLGVAIDGSLLARLLGER